MLVTIYTLNLTVLLINLINFHKFMHIFQLKDYNFARFLKFFRLKLIFVSIIILITILQFLASDYSFIIISDFIILISILCLNYKLIKQNKTPLKYTNKVKRLIAISVVILLAFTCTIYGVGLSCSFIIFLPPLSNILNIYDKLKNKSFIKKAQTKLKQIKPTIIAITGSNGKTSIKNILCKMLENHGCYTTPKSYNTPLGIAKYINEFLPYSCKYLILEYGARHKNDIKKLCKLFGADIGIVSLVSAQHLETFKNIENVYLAKKELADFLGKNLCVFNLDNIFTLRMYHQKAGQKLGISNTHKADIYTDNIRIENYKTNFTLHIENQAYNITTNLLGEHNVCNILLALTVALQLGIGINEIINTISHLEFTPHRLELIKSHVNILDDSYNCSITSAHESLKVLSMLPNKKMVCTPGIIEGGKDEFLINKKLGKMLGFVDFVIIVGNHNKKAITEGLTAIGFKNKILFAQSLNEAKTYFGLLNTNDNLLLLNDLPDDYN